MKFSRNPELPSAAMLPVISAFLVFASLLYADAALAAPQPGWHLEQGSETAGNHKVDFNATSFRIVNPGNGLIITFDGNSQKLYLMNFKAKAYCEMPIRQFTGIAAYHLSNLTWGTFYDYKVAKVGQDKVCNFPTAKYLGAEGYTPKRGTNARLQFFMLEPKSYPPALSSVLCYIYALPRTPGVPVKIHYDVQKTPTGRLSSSRITQVPDLHFATLPPKEWTRVKSQNELAVSGAPVTYSDLFDLKSK